MMVSATQRNGVSQMASERLEILSDVCLAPHTTYKVGGNAALFINVIDPSALQPLLARLEELQIAWLILGNGSNVLFSDAGFDGAVLHLGEGFATAEVTLDAFEPGQHLLEVGRQDDDRVAAGKTRSHVIKDGNIEERIVLGRHALWLSSKEMAAVNASLINGSRRNVHKRKASPLE